MFVRLCCEYVFVCMCVFVCVLLSVHALYVLVYTCTCRCGHVCSLYMCVFVSESFCILACL